jgi:hypothetical protein
MVGGFSFVIVAVLLAGGLNAWYLVIFPFAAAAYALALGKRLPATRGRSLLLLRVFAKQGKLTELLDMVQARWRYVGPIHQIGGPDLATRNVDTYEFMMFLSGRLHEIFLPEAASPELLQARLPVRADREGRYPVNEVFCFNSAWRTTVEQLMRSSDAIVLDVRGLSAQHEGTGYEIKALAQSALLEWTVAVGDNTTDWALVDQLIAEAGQNPAGLKRYTSTSIAHTTELFERLLGVAVARAH